MAISAQGASTEEQRAQAANITLRKALSDAYAALEGHKTIQTFSAFTYEDALDQQVQRLVGKGASGKLNEVEKVDKVLTNLVAAIASIKSQPVEAFIQQQSGQDVNTPAT